MVDLMLGHDPKGFSLGEVSSWFRPWRTHHFDIKCGCGTYPCPVWEELKHVPEDELYRAVVETQSVEFIADSSKKLTWVIDQNRRLLASGDFEVHNVFLYKDPVSLHHSHWKRGQKDLSITAGHYRYYAHALDARIPFIAVNYDWLVRNIDEGLALLCERMGIPHFPAKAEFWRKTHHQLFGSFGPRQQMHAPSPRIYIEEFGADYVEAMPSIEQDFRCRPELQAILGELGARDIRKSTGPMPADSGTIRRPLFYYRQRWRERKMRFFPQPWPDREASSIREWKV